MSTPTEQWRPIPGFDGYEVSDHGNVRSLIRGTPRLLRTHIWGHGYRYANLFKDHRHAVKTIHRLVALAFLGPPEGDRNLVNHIDGNKANNHVSNLEWVSHKENALHAARLGLLRFKRTGRPRMMAA